MNSKTKLIAIAIFFNTCTVQTAVIGYNTKEAGRTGDKLMQFTKALWVAYKHNLPFISSPFKYSDKMLINFSDNAQSKTIAHTLPIVSVRKSADLKPKQHALFQISYYFQDTAWGKPLEVTTWHGLFNNKDFLALLRRHVAPSFFIPAIDIPKDRVAVAVHVRKGGGIDHPLYSDHLNNIKRGFADQIWPIKFPPDKLKRMAEMEHGRWNVERIRAGWSLGERDPEKKISPYLLPWTELKGLPKDPQKWDLEYVSNWPEDFKEAGLEVYELNDSIRKKKK